MDPSSTGKPSDIKRRIRHEARIAGIRDRRLPSIESVERRRLQLWGVAVVVLLALSLGTVIAAWSETPQDGWLSPKILRVAVVLIAAGFCAYAVEKEIHLHRLSRLLVDERVLNSALSKRLEQNAALMAAGKALNSVMDLDEVLDMILASALDLLQGASGSAMLLEDDTLRVVAVRGSELPREARVRLGESIAGRVARSREPVLVVGDVDEAQFPGHRAREQPVESAMSVPLVNRGHLLGVLNVNAGGHRFDEYDLQTLSLFAEPVAAAIAKAGLYELERTHVAELLERDRMKSQFVASMSHELRTPLTSIRGAATASRRAVSDEQRAELLDVIDRQTGRLVAMVEEMLGAAQAERTEAMPLLRRIDLAALVRLAALDSQVAGRPVAVDAPPKCEVRADPESMRRVVGNLIENAHKYGASPVRIQLEAMGSEVVLSVIDSGPGVPEYERERIFERFFRGEATGSKPGVGLGLPIVRGLVDACGGRVWVEDAPDGGAAFRVALKARAQEEREVSLAG